jgi:hypothetical protein
MSEAGIADVAVPNEFSRETVPCPLSTLELPPIMFDRSPLSVLTGNRTGDRSDKTPLRLKSVQYPPIKVD